MKRVIALVAVISIYIPVFVFGVSADLSILQSEISFSGPLIAGDEVRIYAIVRNAGGVDVSGAVTFFQGTIPIGTSQVISVRKDGSPEEVFVDFVVPSGAFNIRAEIQDTFPLDQDRSNDVAISNMQIPLLDDDRDGIPNDIDSCKSVFNFDQKNSDSDSFGDACDDDDDDDGLTDAVEEELTSDPTKTDSDSDGVLDPQDAYPVDGSRSVLPPPVPVPKTFIADVAKRLAEKVAEPVSTTETIVNELNFSPNATFRFEQEALNRFRFEVALPVSEYRYTWDLGDGGASHRTLVSHTYRKPGVYTVSLTTTDQDGEETSDHATIRVPYFTIYNMSMWLVVSLLSFVFLGLCAVLIRRPNMSNDL